MDDHGQDLVRQTSAEHAAFVRSEREKWQIAPLVLMMILLHVIYPSFPISPQVELGRIMTFLGFLWSVGPHRCIAVVNTEPIRSTCRLIWIAMVGAVVHAGIFIIADTISDLIFPLASSAHDLFAGPRYLHQLLVYLAVRYPVREDSLGSSTAWCVVSAVVFSSAVWKEFLFRGVYLGGLRTRMPFWAANMTTALIYALAHEPIYLSPDGSVALQLVGCAPLMIGAMWYGYLYQSCNNLIVTVLAHFIFNATLLGLHLYWS
jgi:membrane protease YdiL (CAAX protease family)